jgi:bZIP transcription factor
LSFSFLRRAQNRAAQRAFRERKERHLKDLETTIYGLRQQRSQLAKELGTTRENLEAFRAENWYLKGVMLTLQFVCLQKHMSIPQHSPYLGEDTLRKMAQTIPHAIDAYVTAYTKNNMAYKPNLGGADNGFKVPVPETSLSPSAFSTSNDNVSTFDSPELVREFSPERSRSVHDQPIFDDIKPEPSDDTDMLINQDPADDEMVKEEQHLLEEDIQLTGKGISTPKPAVNAANIEPSMSAVAAIQRIRLQLRVQKAFSDHAGKTELNIQPTILQVRVVPYYISNILATRCLLIFNPFTFSYPSPTTLELI